MTHTKISDGTLLNKLV